jgi:endonuclease/exonuclease/phosphatase family metal-dependent hydrolase
MKKFDAGGMGVLCVLAALLVPLAGGCTIADGDDKALEKNGTIAVMTWNVQALFDGTEAGNEYDEYREAAGWSREKYRGRLTVMAKAIGGMERRPDVIALQEIESAAVVEDLAAELASAGYRWTYFAGLPGMSLGVGVISRFPLSETKAHSVIVNGSAAPRPMLETRIRPNLRDDAETAGGALALFICHWKSKLGGDDVTEAARRASARIIVRRIRELAESEPELPVIIMGDLNENHDEFYRRSGSVISALLPDDSRSALLTGFSGASGAADASDAGELQKDFIVLCKNKPAAARHFPGQVVALYSPWLNELQNGSYYYKNAWETIDHFLLTNQLFDGTGWEFEACSVLDTPPFAGASGHPVTYNPRTGSGMSDHLPLLLLLKMAAE